MQVVTCSTMEEKKEKEGRKVRKKEEREKGNNKEANCFSKDIFQLSPKE